MTEVKPEAAFDYNQMYAKTLGEVVAQKLSAIESTTTVDYEMKAMFGESVSWSLMQKFVALATRFAQFNSLPKVQSALVGEIQFPSVTFKPNGVLTILNDGSGTLGSIVDKVESILAILQAYFDLAERTVVETSRSESDVLKYDDHRTVLTVIEKLLKGIAKDGVSLPKTFQNLKLKLERHDYIRENGMLAIDLVVEL